MNLLKRIKIENVKGKDVFEAAFTDLYANQPSIIVAPNGYGKSTIATAFKAASSGRMKLDLKDIYQQDESKHPKLEIELCGENAGVYISTDTEGEISRHVYIYTINSPLYAKSTTRGFAMIVEREAEIEGFNSEPIYRLSVKSAGIVATSDRFENRQDAEKILNRLKEEKTALVSSIVSTETVSSFV